jgi:hypothetical protein
LIMFESFSYPSMAQECFHVAIAGHLKSLL